MTKFITYDWAAIEAALEAGDNTPLDEKVGLGKLFNAYYLRKKQEAEAAERAARLKAKKDADPNTPVYYHGSNRAFMAPNIQWMLKAGDGRTYMKVQVLFANEKNAVTWLLHYDNVSLDWRTQTKSVSVAAGIKFAYKVSEKPW